MTPRNTLLPAVLCEDRPAVVASLTSLLRATGYQVHATTDTLPALRAAIRPTAARVAVVALPLTGMAGLAALRALHSDAPWCELIVLEVPDSLASAALAAGARAALRDGDLPGLRAVLLQVAQEPRTVRLPAARCQADIEPVTGSVS